MNISVSNIAWNKEENAEALALLKEHDVNAIDVAPTLLFDSVSDVTQEQIHEVLRKYQAQDISIVGMQSLLFGLPEISLFDGNKERKLIEEHLEKVFFIAKELKVQNLVFGSPKNRFINDLSIDSEKIAVEFFTKISNLAEKYNVTICLEANPKEYGCNFITNTFEAVDFLKKVNKNNFMLNLDTSTIILNNNDFKEVLDYSKQYIRHVHISSPNFQEINKIDHEKISKLLNEINFQGYVALEMKPNINDNNLETLKRNISIMTKYYS